MLCSRLQPTCIYGVTCLTCRCGVACLTFPASFPPAGDSRLLNYRNYETLRYLLSNLRWWIDEYQ